MDNAKKIFSENFTIFGVPSYSDITLHSAWHVCRDSVYQAAPKDYLNENLYCMIYTISGTATLCVKNKSLTLKPNTLTIIKHCDINKYFPVTETWEYFWFNFYGMQYIPQLKNNETYELHNVYLYLNLMGEIFSLMNIYNQINILLVQTLFCELIYRCVKDLKAHNTKYLPNSEYVYDIISYMSRHLDVNMTVREMAKKCLLSEKSFRIVFQKITNESPKKYFCRLRLQKVAEALINTNESISELAYKMNFSSPFQLSRDFKKMFGESPKSFRIKNRM